MHRTWLALSFLCLGLAPAWAQAFDMPPPAGVTVGGCTFNTSPPTVASGSAVFIQCDANGKLIITGTVTSVSSVGITPTDRTITSASGSSQQLAAANASRHSLTIENTGNANCGVNPTGGTAAIGGAGTLTLAPLGAYTPHIPSLSAITIICTAGQPIYGDEN